MLACFLYLMLGFFPWWIFLELENQHLNDITCLTEFCFALTLQPGLEADKEVQGPCLGSQDHGRHENNVAISSAYILSPHLHCPWDFFFHGWAGMGCLAVLPMDARLQQLNSRHLGRALAWSSSVKKKKELKYCLPASNPQELLLEKWISCICTPGGRDRLSVLKEFKAWWYLHLRLN